jgi:hypothetical protein
LRAEKAASSGEDLNFQAFGVDFEGDYFVGGNGQVAGSGRRNGGRGAQVECASGPDRWRWREPAEERRPLRLAFRY